MSKELPAEVLALADELMKGMPEHTEGVAKVEITNKNLPLPDGITIDSLRAHQDFQSVYVTGAAEATAVKAEQAFKDDPNLERYSAAFPLGRDKVAVQIDKEAEINIPGKGKEKRGMYTTVKYRPAAIRSSLLKAYKEKWTKKL